VPHPDDVASFDVFGVEKKREAHLQSKILGTLAYIPGIRVAVTVEVDSSKRVTQKLKHDSAQPKIETSQTSESGEARGAAEPGVQANLGQAVTAGGANQSNTTEETTVENFEPKLSQTETIEQIPFAIKSVAAAVGIPRSFIVGIYGAKFPDKEAPKDDDPEFVRIREEQLERVKTSVERIVMAKGPKDVEVNVFPDMEWTPEGTDWKQGAGAAGVAQASAEPMDSLATLTGYGPQVGLSALALLSLFMMMRIVRSVPSRPATEAVAIKKAGAPEEDEPLLAAGSSAIGKAALSESLLIGREVDDDTLRYQELTEEVSKLVEADPEGAAELIRRWMDEP
jgi:flagellar biosynthesis/type III secretory pathway M-ring protein FliF/YscJ